jgi:hypothetical protein
MEAPTTRGHFVVINKKIIMYHSSFINQSKSVAKIAVFGLLSFAVTTSSASAMTQGDTLVQIQNQLSQVSQTLFKIQANLPAGVVLGASTTAPRAVATAPVRPTCRVITDKNVYKLGDNIKFSWTTASANKVEFVADLSGKDALTLPTGTLATVDSANIPASVLGSSIIILKVTSVTGQTMTCSRSVSVLATTATGKDVKTSAIQAILKDISNRLNDIAKRRAELNTLEASLLKRQSELQAKLGGVSTSTTSTTGIAKPLLSFVRTSAVMTPAAFSTQHSYGTYTIVYNVTTQNGDVYIPKSIMRAGFSAPTGVLYVMTNGASNRATADGSTTATIVPNSSVETSGNYFVIREGDSADFTVSIVYSPLALGYFKASMYSLFWTDDPTHALKEMVFGNTFSSMLLSYSN